MTTESKLPALYAQSLTQHERSKHRAWIGVRVESALSHFWRDRPSDLVMAEIMRDWMEALENYTQDEIRTAFREHIQSTHRKPTPSDIRKLVIGKRMRDQPVVHEPEPEREPCSPEAARQILEKAGFAPRKFSQ